VKQIQAPSEFFRAKHLATVLFVPPGISKLYKINGTVMTVTVNEETVETLVSGNLKALIQYLFILMYFIFLEPGLKSKCSEEQEAPFPRGTAS
jgi:hypothetical protein